MANGQKLQSYFSRKEHICRQTWTVKMTCKSVDILSKVSSNYKRFSTEEKGNKVIFLQLKKALHVSMQPPMLGYNTFSGTHWRRKVSHRNNYNLYMANKTIIGKQYMVRT